MAHVTSHASTPRTAGGGSSLHYQWMVDATTAKTIRHCSSPQQREPPMKPANDNEPLPFIQIAATLANVMTYLSLKQQKASNDADRNEEGRNNRANAVC